MRLKQLKQYFILSSFLILSIANVFLQVLQTNVLHLSHSLPEGDFEINSLPHF